MGKLGDDFRLTLTQLGDKFNIDNTALSIFVVILVELTNTVFFNSTNITTNIETAALSTGEGIHRDADLFSEKGFV